MKRTLQGINIIMKHLIGVLHYEDASDTERRFVKYDRAGLKGSCEAENIPYKKLPNFRTFSGRSIL